MNEIVTVRRWLPLAIGIVVAAVCARLGFWQLDRLGQRMERNAALEVQLKIVSRQGTFDFERQQIVMLRPRRGVPGVFIATPLFLSDSTVMLVERGWVPSPDGKTVDLDQLTEPRTTVAEGYLVPADTTSARPEEWPAFVRTASPALVPLPNASPEVLRRTRLPEAAPPRMEPMELPDLTNGPHLSYAIQWFAFGLIALVGSGVLAFKPHA